MTGDHAKDMGSMPKAWGHVKGMGACQRHGDHAKGMGDHAKGMGTMLKGMGLCQRHGDHAKNMGPFQRHGTMSKAWFSCKIAFIVYLLMGMGLNHQS